MSQIVDDEVWNSLPEDVQQELLKAGVLSASVLAEYNLMQTSGNPLKQAREDDTDANFARKSARLGSQSPPQSPPPPGFSQELWNTFSEELKKDIRNDFRHEAPNWLKSPNWRDLIDRPDVSGIDSEAWLELPDEIRSEMLNEAITNSISSKSSKNKNSPAVPLGSRNPITHEQLYCITPCQSGHVNEPPHYYSSLADQEMLMKPPPSSFPDQFVDAEFPADVRSIDGIADDPSSSSSNTPTESKCKCGLKPRLRYVSKENQNQGRPFLTCPKSGGGGGAKKPEAGCNYFAWTEVKHKPEDVQVMWKQLTASDGYVVVNADTRFKPDDVCQGGVGDCWFLSALAVVAERHDLIDRILITQTMQENGAYVNRLFIDGHWQYIVVDDKFALLGATGKKPRRAPNPEDGVPLKYAKSVKKQIWVPILEKAYAKAHGSYRGISGGLISEGLFDLTGYPTEEIYFGGERFSSEVLWARLLSFQSHHFLMGAVCPMSGDGLVGRHAYSILDVREVEVQKAGRFKTLEEYFGIDLSATLQAADRGGWREAGDDKVRLLKIRNPWGAVEWKGSFGAGSAEWSSELRKELGKVEDGVFWISYHDFLQRFIQVDVCYAYKNWFSLNLVGKLPPGSGLPRAAYELSIFEPTWIHISLCQPNKRGKAQQRYFYTDLSLLVLHLSNDGGVNIEDCRLFGPGRVSHFDLLLKPDLDGKEARYLLVPFSIEREAALQEEAIFGKYFTFGAGGMKKGKGSAEVPFTIRVMSAHAIMANEVYVGSRSEFHMTVNRDSIWDWLDRAMCDSGLIDRDSCGVPMLTMDKEMPISVESKSFARFRVLESGGMSLAHVVNTNPTHTFELKVKLRAASKTFSSTLPEEWRKVPPMTRMFVGACIAPCSESIRGTQMVSIENVEWRVSSDSTPSRVSSSTSSYGIFQPFPISIF